MAVSESLDGELSATLPDHAEPSLLSRGLGLRLPADLDAVAKSDF